MDSVDNMTVWRLLLALGRTGSLTRATIATDLELSAASRLLSNLEKELGVALIDRRKKPMALAENAKPLLAKVQDLLEAHRMLLESAVNLASNPRLVIRVSIPSNIARRSMLPLLARYREEVDSEVEFELYSNLDHADVLNGLVDVAYLPYFPANVPGLHVLPVLRGTNFMVASPAYLEQHGTPECVEDLVNHDLFVRTGRYYPVTTRLFSLTEMFDFETLERQPLPDRLGQLAQHEYSYVRRLRRRSRLRLQYGDSLSGFQCAIEGLGIAVDLSLGFLHEQLEKGRLVPVLKEWHRPLWNNTIVTRERNLLNEPVVRFMNWFAREERLLGPERWKYWYRRYGMDPEAVLERGY